MTCIITITSASILRCKSSTETSGLSIADVCVITVCVSKRIVTTCEKKFSSAILNFLKPFICHGSSGE
jgi:hypothetical protein